MSPYFKEVCAESTLGQTFIVKTLERKKLYLKTVTKLQFRQNSLANSRTHSHVAQYSLEIVDCTKSCIISYTGEIQLYRQTALNIIFSAELSAATTRRE